MTEVFLDKMREGKELLGIYLSLFDPATVELAAQSGYDFARVDLEHTLMGMGELRELIRTASLAQLPVFVRVPSLESVAAMLDMGADGIMVPGVNSVEMAEKAIALTKYAPLGCRGMAGSQRNTRFGAERMKDYTARANREVLLCVQIESREGIGQIDEILSLEGIDMVSTGRLDLSQSFGLAGQNEHPDILAAEDTIVRKAIQYGKLPVLLVNTLERKNALAEKGVRGFMTGRDSLLLGSAMRSNVNVFRGL